jgi:hypothetical protein
MKMNFDNQTTAQGHSKPIWDYSLNLQFLSRINPDFGVELGVWKGSTFQIIEKYCKKAIGFDNHKWTTFGEYKHLWEKSWDIREMDIQKIDKNDFGGKDINFAHVDASKEFSKVIKELEIIRDNLHADGIICIADYITHRDVFTATQYFLRENREFNIKVNGYNQVYLVKSGGADLIEDTISRFDEKIVKSLKLESTYSVNMIPKNFKTDIDFAIMTQKNVSEDLKKFYKDFNR